MSGIFNEASYIRSIKCLMDLSPEDSSVKAIANAKITKLVSPLLEESAFSEETKLEASTIAASLNIPSGTRDFTIVMQACHDFHIVLDQAKEIESEVFHVEAPPVISLEPVHAPLNSNHSILKHSARSARELIEVSKLFNPNAIRNFIPLTPERLVMHNLTRRFLLNFSLQGDLSEELVRVIEPLTKRFISSSDFMVNFPLEDTAGLIEELNVHELEAEPSNQPNFIERCEIFRRNSQQRALKYLKNGQSGDMNESFVESIERLKSQVRSDTGLSSEQIDEAISMRLADLAVESFIKMAVNEYDMNATPELSGYKALPQQTLATRRTFMINGGIASGKSTSQTVQSRIAKSEGVEWEDVLTINRDAFKPMLLKPEEVNSQYKEFFASFAEDEAFLLRDSILQEYKERLEADTAPHLYIDQVWPNADMMLMAGKNEGLGLDLTIVQTPVENSFRMAHGRKEKTGYAAVTLGLLSTHAGVPAKLLESLETAKKVGATNIRLKIVANLQMGEVSPVVDIDFKSKSGVVRDREILLSFFQKTQINLKAKRFEEIYPSKISSFEVFESMIDRLLAEISILN